MEMKLELIMVPVTDVDVAKAFDEKVGFHVDQDQTVSNDLRFVQLTPPGIGLLDRHRPRDRPRCSPARWTTSEMVVADADATLADLGSRGVDATGVQDLDWGRFVGFADPTATDGRSRSCPTGRPTPAGQRYAIGPYRRRRPEAGLSCRA